MKKEALSQFGHPDLILLSFLLFFFCFIGMVIWAVSRKNKNHFNAMSMLPLHKDKRSVSTGASNE